MGACSPLSAVSPHLDAIKTALSSDSDQLTPREHAYIRATLAFANGSVLNATEELRNMVIDYPLGKVFVHNYAYHNVGYAYLHNAEFSVQYCDSHRSCYTKSTGNDIIKEPSVNM